MATAIAPETARVQVAILPLSAAPAGASLFFQHTCFIDFCSSSVCAGVRGSASKAVGKGSNCRLWTCRLMA